MERRAADLQEMAHGILSRRIPLTELAKVRFSRRVQGNDVIWTMFLSDGLDRVRVMDFPGNYDDGDIEMKLQNFISNEDKLYQWLRDAFEEDKDLMDSLIMSTHGAEVEEGASLEEETPDGGGFTSVDILDVADEEEWHQAGGGGRGVESGGLRDVRDVVVLALRLLLDGSNEEAIALLADLSLDLSNTQTETVELLTLGIFEQKVALKEPWRTMLQGDRDREREDI